MKLGGTLSPCAMSTIRPGFLYEWMYIISPIEPSVKAGLNTGMLFLGKGGRGKRERGEAVMEGGGGWREEE